MKSLLDVLRLSTEFLDKRGIAGARRQAEELLSISLGIPRLELYVQFERPLSDDELALCRAHLMRRAKGEPAAYIAGSVEFYNCQIEVNNHVLIPRPETEIMVDMIVKEITGSGILWDLCCGSGCIGLAIKKALPDLDVVLVDKSSAALDVAKRNAEANELEVEFLQSDLLTGLRGRQVDYLVCNPPYISTSEFGGLDRQVREFEPEMALHSGPSGLEFYERLAVDLPGGLKRGGKAWLELGRGQGPDVEQMFQSPVWSRAQVKVDWAGHDRFFLLERQ